MSTTASLATDVTAATSATFATFHSAVVNPRRDRIVVSVDVGVTAAVAATTLQLLVGSTAYPLGIVALGTTRCVTRTVRTPVPIEAALTIALQYKVAASGTFSCEPVTGAPTNNWATITVIDDA